MQIVASIWLASNFERSQQLANIRGTKCHVRWRREANLAVRRIGPKHERRYFILLSCVLRFDDNNYRFKSDAETPKSMWMEDEHLCGPLQFDVQLLLQVKLLIRLGPTNSGPRLNTGH